MDHVSVAALPRSIHNDWQQKLVTDDSRSYMLDRVAPIRQLPIDLDTLHDELDFSLERGFLGAQTPIDALPSGFEPWEMLIKSFDQKLKSKEILSAVKNLPLLDATALQSRAEMQRAFVILTFVANGYIWSTEPPQQILPSQIAVPLDIVSKKLDLKPIACFASLCLWNWEVIDPNGPLSIDNLRCKHTFTGTRDEEWFYLVSIAIEASGAQALVNILEAFNAAKIKDKEAYIASMHAFAQNISSVSAVLRRMRENCNPHTFYYTIRRNFMGWTDNTKFERGVFYEGCSDDKDEFYGDGVWRRFQGGSNAQSSLIHTFDIALSVKHSVSNDDADNTSADASSGASSSTSAKDYNSGNMMDTRPKKSFNDSMRAYMPGAHRNLLEYLEKNSEIREYACQNAGICSDIVDCYNTCVRALTDMRRLHLQIVANFIIVPSQAEKRDSHKPKVQIGTGGSKISTMLRQTLDETMNALLL